MLKPKRIYACMTFKGLVFNKLVRHEPRGFTYFFPVTVEIIALKSDKYKFILIKLVGTCTGQNQLVGYPQFEVQEVPEKRNESSH